MYVKKKGGMGGCIGKENVEKLENRPKGKRFVLRASFVMVAYIYRSGKSFTFTLSVYLVR